MYKVIYLDKTEFNGGKPNNSLWKKVEDKGIKELHYAIGVQRTLVMKGYERYNHLVEHQAVLGKGKSRIVGIVLMGEKKDCVELIRLCFKTGKVYQALNKLGQEYNGRLTTGWKPGAKGDKASWEIINESAKSQ